MAHPLRWFSVSAVALGLAVIPGCYAETDPPVAYADVTAAPVEIETGPSVVYAGHPTYFYGGRWWYRDGGRWAYYRREPAELGRRRPVERREERHEERHEERR